MLDPFLYFVVSCKLAAMPDQSFKLMIKIMRTGMKMRRAKKGKKGKVNSLLLRFS